MFTKTHARLHGRIETQGEGYYETTLVYDGLGSRTVMCVGVGEMYISLSLSYDELVQMIERLERMKTMMQPPGENRT